MRTLSLALASALAALGPGCARPPAPARYALTAVWGRSATDVWAVGYSGGDLPNPAGTVLHWNGRVWSQVPAGTPIVAPYGSGGYYGPAILYGIWGSGASDIWVAGDGGVILHWNSPPPGKGETMAHIEKSVVVDAPLADVFRYANTLGKTSEWFPLEVRNPNKELAEKGAKYDWSYSMVGIKFDGVTEYTDVVTNERVRLKTTGGIPSQWEYRYSSDGTRTRVEVTVDYDVPGKVLGKIADKLVVERINASTVEHALANLKAICEAEKSKR